MSAESSPIESIDALVASCVDEVEKIYQETGSYYNPNLIPDELKENLEYLIEKNFKLQKEFTDFGAYANLMRRNYAARMRLFLHLGSNAGFQTELHEFHTAEFPGRGMAAMTKDGSLILASPGSLTQYGRLPRLFNTRGGKFDYLRLPFRPDPDIKDTNSEMVRVKGIPKLGSPLEIEGKDNPFGESSPLIEIAAGTDLQNFGNKMRQGTEILGTRR